MKTKALIAGVALAASAFGSTASAGMIYATDVVWNQVGPVGSHNNRNIKENALGEQDGAFLSLSLGGSADFSFGESFTGPGQTIEVTFGTPGNYLETAEVWVGNGTTFEKLGTVNNATQDPVEFTFTGVFDTLRLIDVTKLFSPDSRSDDGYDVDAVGVTRLTGPNPSPQPVPLPAPALLLGAGLLGLGGLRRLRAKG